MGLALFSFSLLYPSRLLPCLLLPHLYTDTSSPSTPCFPLPRCPLPRLPLLPPCCPPCSRQHRYINHTNFTNNYAGDGGGGVGLVTHFEWNIRNCLFEGNRAEKEGGGIYLTDDKTENFKVNIINQIYNKYSSIRRKLRTH